MARPVSCESQECRCWNLSWDLVINLLCIRVESLMPRGIILDVFVLFWFRFWFSVGPENWDAKTLVTLNDLSFDEPVFLCLLYRIMIASYNPKPSGWVVQSCVVLKHGLGEKKGWPFHCEQLFCLTVKLRYSAELGSDSKDCVMTGIALRQGLQYFWLCHVGCVELCEYNLQRHNLGFWLFAVYFRIPCDCWSLSNKFYATTVE